MSLAETCDTGVLPVQNDVTLDSIRDLKLFQRKNGYRYCADALLLADFVCRPRIRQCVDLGTGVGIVGLLIAKRWPEARVTGIEIQTSMVELAEKNVGINGLNGRVCMVHGDARDAGHIMGESTADLVVSNPPFRKAAAGRLSPSGDRRVARHEVCLSVDGLVAAASEVLKRRGSFCMIHLSERLAEILSTLISHGMEPKRIRFVHGNAKEASTIFLVEAVKGARPGLRIEPPLTRGGSDSAKDADSPGLNVIS